MISNITLGTIEGLISALISSYILARFNKRTVAKNFKSFLISSIAIAHVVIFLNHLWGLSSQPILIGLLLAIGFHICKEFKKQGYYVLALSSCFLAIGINLALSSDQNFIQGCILISIALSSIALFELGDNSLAIATSKQHMLKPNS